MFNHFPEGATPIEDASGLIPNWVHHLNDLNRVEAENILKAQRRYFKRPIQNPKIWFRIIQLRAIHKAMFGDVWNWAGAYRKSVTSIGIAPSLIPFKLAEFCHEVNSWLEFPVELTFLEMSARIHHKLVFIHPFENGNGRFSRFIADRFLFSLRCAFPFWPSSLSEEGMTRKGYISTLRAADQGDYEPLIEMMKKLGARDPSIDEIDKNSFCKKQMIGEKRIALLKALLRYQQISIHSLPGGDPE